MKENNSGLYLVIYFLLLLEERNVTNAILSLIPILSGIFLIFPWVLVDQLYVKCKQTKIIIEMNNPITRSISSLRYSQKCKKDFGKGIVIEVLARGLIAYCEMVEGVTFVANNTLIL